MSITIFKYISTKQGVHLVYCNRSGPEQRHRRRSRQGPLSGKRSSYTGGPSMEANNTNGEPAKSKSQEQSSTTEANAGRKYCRAMSTRGDTRRSGSQTGGAADSICGVGRGAGGGNRGQVIKCRLQRV